MEESKIPPQHNEKKSRMEDVARRIGLLRVSPLYELRDQKGYKAVIGEGSLDADVMFIGEAPGEQEAKSGMPFVGASGRVLTDLLASIGLSREEVYITNVVKDRPPDNRDPLPDEIAEYAPFLREQIEIIQPRVIATLGRFAMDFVLNLFGSDEAGKKISQMHGKPVRAQASYGLVDILPLYHPAVALYRRDQRETLEDDFRQLRALL